MKKAAMDHVEQIFQKSYISHKAGRFSEAEEGYREILEIKPEWGQAMGALGMLYLDQNLPDKAIPLFEKAAGLNPPDAAPVEHVRSIFNQCAENFEDILVDGLEYKTPELLFRLVRPHLTENMEILDLGCGTGLGAVLYQPFAKRLTGVDVSEKMLEKAAEKKIYSHLAVFDILQPWAFPAKFDLIYSSDVFVYFGSLDQIIQSAAAALGQGGKIAFSVERLKDDTKDYQLYPSGRYAHSEKYIQTCLNGHGFIPLALDSTDIRMQSGNPVTGFLVVAEKQN
jgi:predicted TPR repeat methyltransferase